MPKPLHFFVNTFKLLANQHTVHRHVTEPWSKGEEAVSKEEVPGSIPCGRGGKICPLSVGVIGRLFPSCTRPNGKRSKLRTDLSSDAGVTTFATSPTEVKEAKALLGGLEEQVRKWLEDEWLAFEFS
eukprot:1152565-Pelagomonas_calceolata.AAC.3